MAVPGEGPKDKWHGNGGYTTQTQQVFPWIDHAKEWPQQRSQDQAWTVAVKTGRTDVPPAGRNGWTEWVEYPEDEGEERWPEYKEACKLTATMAIQDVTAEDQTIHSSSASSEAESEEENLDNKDRHEEANAKARKLREMLKTFTSEAERIKGATYGQAAVEQRWNKRLAMSVDEDLMEVDAEGHAVSIYNIFEYANTSGNDAQEALKAMRYTCCKCKALTHDFKSMILHADGADGLNYCCRKCYSRECMDDELDKRAYRVPGGADVELGTNQFRKDKAAAENRPFHTMYSLKKTALGQIAKQFFGKRDAKNMAKMREVLSEGINTVAIEAYTDLVDKIAAKGTMTTDLAKLVVGTDFMPMVADNVSYRYSCRRSACRKIPLKETSWFITTSEDGTGKKTKWNCSACGMEYKHAIKDGPEDSLGQDLKFNYVVFLQFRMKHGLHTFCAMAEAPCDYLNDILATLKLVLAYSKVKFNRGAQVAITDMMTASNDMFVEAMKGFPKVTLKVAKPVHHQHGEYIKIAGNGVESLSEKDIGTNMSFLDMNTALQKGFFGKDPVVWRDPEWKLLIDYVTQGLDISDGEWDNMAYMPQIWNTLTEVKKKVPPSGKKHLAYLRERAKDQDEYMNHMMNMPAFHSDDALSTITDSTRMDSGEESAKSVNTKEDAVWNEALKRNLPATMAKAARDGKHKPKAKSQRKSKEEKAKESGPSGASSSWWAP